MVHFEDTGVIIDAPLEFVREYLVSSHHRSARSKSARNSEVRENAGPTALVSAERYLDGKWSTVASTSSDFPPSCICNAAVEGDLAGTKFVLLYRPGGERTPVDAYGYVRSSDFGPDEAKKLFPSLLENAYTDDASVISALRPKRSP